MLICSKSYFNIPFSHRQHLHDGNCSKIHGHNWAITLEFECSELDKNGFVVDFGNLKYIQNFINNNLDHASLFSKNDTIIKKLMSSEYKSLLKVLWVKNSSCEGIAKFLFKEFSKLVKNNEGNRVWIKTLTLYEDSKNFVTYAPSKQLHESI